eukprot:514103-Rhodomonas_salina.2
MEDGGWRMEDGGWRIEDGGRRRREEAGDDLREGDERHFERLEERLEAGKGVVSTGHVLANAQHGWAPAPRASAARRRS